MSSFPNSPYVIKGGIVLLDPTTAQVQKIIALQYNPDTLTRSLQVQAVTEGSDRSEALRLKGPPVETFKVEAEIDATDQLEAAGQNRTVVENGIHPQISALEMIVYPRSTQAIANFALSQTGTLEIMPVEAPLTLFVWSARRILPVRLTEFSITEEAFDTKLNPIRAKVSLGMRALSFDDLGFATKGGSLFLAYQQQKERLAALSQGSSFGTLGIGGIP
ncbi:MAG TPA: hypothetical protein VFH91_00640 [Pyrinomonadaceae bacterium]|nr:hypothetical protein [Pyrinomonadaceae bacterium]